MNKFQKELLEKCKNVEFNENIPLLDDIYILPTQRKHESGYKIMYIVGYVREKNQYYLLDTYCDVVNFGYLKHHLKELNIDILDSGIIHCWSNCQKMENSFRCSSCTFDFIDRETMFK